MTLQKRKDSAKRESDHAMGYDLEIYAYSALNDMMSSAKSIFTLAEKAANGEVDTQDVMKYIRAMIYAAGQLFGIPTRNLFNIISGLTRRISPTAGYTVDSLFYNKNYRSDLAKAIEREDDAMIATISGLILDENIGEISNASARGELNRLISKGFNVIPRSIGTTVKYDGEETTLSKRQAKAVKAVYSTANTALADLLQLSLYQQADDEARANAVRFLYSTYYDLAIEDILGVELAGRTTLFAEAIDIEKLAIIVAMARQLKADTDKNGNAVAGSKKAKVVSYVNSLHLTAAQKYMVMGYLGYSNTKGEAQVQAYIRKLNLSKEEQKQLLRYSGYAA